MSLSKQLINGFIESELELYQLQFDESPVPEIQNERSLSIAWLFYYFKNSISNKNSSTLIQFVDKVNSSENYSIHGWFRISALQAAAYILTSDILYANSLVKHIGCEQGWARGFIIESASIICPLLSFDNQELKAATERNIKYSHGLYEESIILYLSTIGTSAEKVRWLENQISIYEKDNHGKFLNSLKVSGKLSQSEFFVRTFSKAKSYIIFKLLSQPFLAEFQPKHFIEASSNFKELTDLEKKHPLNDYYIDLSFLSNENKLS